MSNAPPPATPPSFVDHFLLLGFSELESKVPSLREGADWVVKLVRARGANREEHLLDVQIMSVEPFIVVLITVPLTPWPLVSSGRAMSYTTRSTC